MFVDWVALKDWQIWSELKERVTFGKTYSSIWSYINSSVVALWRFGQWIQSLIDDQNESLNKILSFSMRCTALNASVSELKIQFRLTIGFIWK